MIEELMIAELKEFKNFLRRYKEADSKIDSIFEEGRVPSKRESNSFEKLKKEYQDYMAFFTKWDFDVWDSEAWTPLSVAERLVKESGI